LSLLCHITKVNQQMLANRYQIGKKLGEGGMGEVFLGRDTQSQQPVAIKRLKNDFVEPELIERFIREGEALRELNHPNIVKLLDAVDHDDTYYLVMEYIAGGDLAHLLKTEQLPIEKVLELSLDLVDALTRAHKLDIIHRDLKPANILIADDSTLRLSDFGIAHIGRKKRVTATDVIVGTIEYLAPEAFDGTGIDFRADIWAFGVMLFEMVAGKRPFTGDNYTQTFMAIMMQPVPDLEALRPDVPTALVDLVYRMLEKDRNARIRSIRQVGLELEDILYGRIVEPAPTTRFAVETPAFSLRPRHNLPAQITPFVGRETEIAELAQLLDNPQIRLTTVLAPGGMGKTRLALETAEQQLSNFEHGVYFVDLAPLSDPTEIVSAIATATSYQFQADEREQKQQILDFLSNKDMLLVLDNYEHLLEEAGLVTDILKATPKVKILVTSRQRLNQLSETIFNLQGMDFPAWETPADALEYAAVKLFLQSARRAMPDFKVTADNMDAIARICKLVQGMPLGIVMAAAWIGMLSAEEIAAEIAQSIDFLASDMGDIPERQRSMRAVFDYSWQQMTQDEQFVFMKLSIFRGGCTREAARVVTGANLVILMSLTNKSLIRREVETGRYEIHPLLQQYAQEKLKAANQYAEVLDAHTTYYANQMSNIDESLWRKVEAIELRQRLTPEITNIHQMWHHAVNKNMWAMLEAIVYAFHQLHMFNLHHRIAYESLTELVTALEKYHQANLNNLKANALIYTSIQLQRVRTNAKLTLDLAKQGLDLIRGLELVRLTARGIVEGNLNISNLGFPAECQLSEVERALAFYQQTDDLSGMATALCLIGTVLATQPHPDTARAQELLEAGAEAATAANDLLSLGWAHEMLHHIEMGSGNYEKALEHGIKSVETHDIINSQVYQANHVREVAMAAFAFGNYRIMLEYLDKFEARHEKLDWSPWLDYMDTDLHQYFSDTQCVEWYVLVMQHRPTFAALINAQQRLNELEVRLDADEFAAAVQRAKTIKVSS
jgi:predicted ATPase/tRNA A-37 threonylcarbamoyl transferase component Bud32